MTKLSPKQSGLLAAAASGDDGIIDARGAPATIASLVERGLLISLPKDDGPARLQITDAGRVAIQPPESEAPPVAPPVEVVEPPPTKVPRRVGALVAISIAPGTPTWTVGASRKRAGEGGKTSDEPPASQPKGKIGALVDLLRQPGGTTVEAMMAATGWQAHSVRGAISGSIKKGLGLVVISEKTEGGRIYRISSEAGA